MEKNPYRFRIKIIVDILNEITKLNKDITRKNIVDIVKRIYDKHGLKPFKGKSNPLDLYDKELASLYVIGKYGLGLDSEYPDLFNRVFYVEKTLEDCINLLVNNKYEESRELLKSISSANVVDSNTLARMLRIPFTKLVFGFITEEEFSNILKKTYEAFPEEARTVRNYVKFYIAFKIADMIYRGKIRDRSYKEAFKKALALKIGFPRVVPSDEYILTISREVFNIPEEVLHRVLSISRRESEEEK